MNRDDQNQDTAKTTPEGKVRSGHRPHPFARLILTTRARHQLRASEYDGGKMLGTGVYTGKIAKSSG